MENETLHQLLEEIKSLRSDIKTVNNNVQLLESKMDTGFSNINKKISELSQDIAHIVSNDVAHVISVQLDDLKREVSIIKSAVGEHELDLKYFKKISMSQFQSPTS